MIPQIPTASVWTAIALALAIAAGWLSRRWDRSGKRTEQADDQLVKARAALEQARRDGNLPRVCELQRRVRELEEQAGLAPK